METVQELIPLAKEMMAQKPNGKMMKFYVLGSVLAFVGVVIGLVETVCSPFCANRGLQEDDAAMAAVQAARFQESKRREALLEKSKQQEAFGASPIANTPPKSSVQYKKHAAPRMGEQATERQRVPADSTVGSVLRPRKLLISEKGI